VSPRDDYCKSAKCQRPIVWALMPNGHALPLDPGEDPAGHIAVSLDRDGELLGRFLGRDRTLEPGETLAKSHKLTCPDAGRWRKKRSGSKSRMPSR
jgi:hypothetical protein